jgi:exocyst complex component 4
MRSITTSQAKVRDLRESLIKAKEDLSTSKPEVKNMVDNSQKYDAMLQTLHSMSVTFCLLPKTRAWLTVV